MLETTSLKLGPVQQRVLAMADGRFTVAQAAARLGVRVGSVHIAARRLREKGFSPVFAHMKGQKTAPKEARALTKALGGLPPHIAQWAADQIPEGGTIADLIRGFIVDAYHEERG